MTPSDPVVCRSDHAYTGYPLALDWQGKRLPVTRIVSESRHPSGYTFRVLTEENGCFILNYDFHTDLWSVDQV